MKIEFDSPLDYTDGDPIDATTLASLQYQVFIDTVNPPVKSYPVASSALSAATSNVNGTKHVTVDCVKGDATGFTPVAGTTYYIAAADSVDENGNTVSSAPSSVVTYKYAPVPAAPGNFTVGS